ncbi:hypothetical protein NPA07_00735 [Mycoplasmopsis caviae]|uniref:Uncharacterized protein n=1 Tax=Mycoplasmopsis caviae TaxID=55603 RepID=A0A3P8LHZ2_9BACT|nr:hypothetical protein [Mycoplasmopsis caviae]UUD35391.1 hypothetical protein NPA07_00735 [Mycoplasmopsis caviae]VDR41832.1 Uncharacterised protein [Mycoplasmopsis caviae]
MQYSPFGFSAFFMFWVIILCYYYKWKKWRDTELYVVDDEGHPSTIVDVERNKKKLTLYFKLAKDSEKEDGKVYVSRTNYAITIK